MSDNKDKINIVRTSTKEYLKYSDVKTEKQAIEALYNYYNTRQYVKLMQMS